MRMIANKAFSYDGRNLAAGEEFNVASESDRRILVLAGLAHEQSYLNEDFIAPPKRSYKRRDMKAEE